MALGRTGAPDFELALPSLVMPGATFSPEAVLTISVPMVVLVLGLGNVQALGYLEAQGYRVPANPLTVAIGVITSLSALLGGHPAAMTRVSSAILGGPESGPLERRYWGALVAYVGVVLVALTSGLMIALVLVLPPAYVFAVAGLAIFAAFQDALIRAFSGSLRSGSVVAFGVTLSTVVIAGIPSAFWALPAGIVASLILEREELFATWRPVVAETV